MYFESVGIIFWIFSNCTIDVQRMAQSVRWKWRRHVSEFSDSTLCVCLVSRLNSPFGISIKRSQIELFRIVELMRKWIRREILCSRLRIIYRFLRRICKLCILCWIFAKSSVSFVCTHMSSDHLVIIVFNNSNYIRVKISCWLFFLPIWGT